MAEINKIGRLKCKGRTCYRILGEIFSDGSLHIKSSRSSWPIEVILNHGMVKCRNCGTEITWNVNNQE